MPIIKEPELTANAQTAPAAPLMPLIMSVLEIADGVGLGATLVEPGCGEPVGTSFATADNRGVSSVTPNMPKIVPTPTKKDFRFDLG